MLFSSIVFILYFLPVALGGYYLLSFSRKAQNIWLLLASILFYAWGEPLYVLILLCSIIFHFGAGRAIERNRDARIIKTTVLLFACGSDLALLVYFKYLGFLAESINMILGRAYLHVPETVLPIGLSFYTLHALSYLIDVYRGELTTEKKLLDFALYLAFFPQLIAGPLMRYHELSEQIRSRKSTYRKFSVGVCRFVVGLGKKVLLADNLAVLADTIFGWSEMGTEHVEVTIVMAWIGLFAYTLQIYFDFSGYSDMAVGLGLLFGFKLDENFRYPYAAASVSDFWKRWNITLAGWFREYVYLPLGGSRVQNKDKMVRNLAIVWLLTGIWHGAGWNFLFWGIWNFLFLLMEHFLGYGKVKESSIWQHVYTMAVVMTGWVVFHCGDLYQASIYYRNLLGMNGNSLWNAATGFLLKEYWIFLLSGMLLCLPIAQHCNTALAEERLGRTGRLLTILYPPALLALFILCLIYIVQAGAMPFIYFAF